MLRSLLLIIILVLSLQGFAQVTIQEILSTIEKNNPELRAHEQYIDAQNLGYKAQNNLANPEFEWEKSFSSEEGKPYEILVSQSFDFPTSYIYKNQLKKEQIANSENYKTELRQNILLKAKLLCIELIYLNKQKTELNKRLSASRKLNDYFDKRLKEGDANILEVNKIRMLRLNTQNQLKMLTSKIFNLHEDLKKINGGKSLAINSIVYPEISLDKNMNVLLQESLNADPRLKLLSANEIIASKQTSLVKTKSLPKISIGYRYLNSDVMKKANGIKLGLSIPLWENKHKVKQAKLIEQFRKEEYSIGKMEKENNFLKLFHNYLSLDKSLKEYQKIFSEKQYDQLLQKALKFGEISGIEYLTESIYYYDSFDTYLEIEYEYNKTIAQIQKFKL